MLRLSQGLSPSDQAAVAELERRVVAADGGRLKLGWPTLATRPADEINDALWTADDGTVLGFAGIYPFGPVPEIAGMVDPTARRRGIGGELLDALLGELRERGVPRALIVCPRTAGGGAAFTTAHGGTPDHSEHALLLRGSPVDGPANPLTVVRPARPGDEALIARLLDDGFGFAPPIDVVDGETEFLVLHDDDVAGYLRVSLELDTAEPRGDVYGFVVRSDLRGRGIGRDVLRRTCLDLLQRGARVVGLEVETQNESALGLYTSLGFGPVVTEDYLGLTVGG